jgi:hypothetical protein
MYAPFDESSSSFGQSVGDFSIKGHYECIFNQIKDKLFDPFNYTEIKPEIRQQLEAKYQTMKFQNTLDRLKHNITEIYVKKIETEIKLQEKQRLFDNFCNNIIKSVESISEITDNEETPNDTKLKELLSDRIDWYHTQLGITELLELERDIRVEFEFLRKSIIEISNLEPNVCVICMENQVLWFNDPCGHTLCGSCNIKTEQNKNCHYCRVEKKITRRLFL